MFSFVPMSMDVKGKVIQLLAEQSGTSKKGTWRKQEFVVETQGQYPKKVCFSVWGEKIDQYQLKTGDLVNVSFDLESREYNNRWYTEARAWKIEKSGSENTPAFNDSIPVGDEPFNAGPQSADDLPF